MYGKNELYIQRIITIITSTIGVISGLLAIAHDWGIIVEWFQSISTYISMALFYTIVYSVSIVTFPVAVIITMPTLANFATRNYRRKIGTHNIPCSLISLYNFKFVNRNNKLLDSIHRDIYHKQYKLKEKIQKGEIDSIESMKYQLEEMLHYFHATILKAFNLDVTINVKRLSLDRQENLCLVPFIHYRNIAERELDVQRAFNYSYYIDTTAYERLSRYAERAKSYHKKYGADRKYEVNSIFTYLLTQQKRYWMSNDLEEDVKKGDFYTSSDNYPQYYKSLAVFSIIPPEKNNVLPEGLVIFDTNKIGKFSEKECVNLFGYIAHLLYELLKEYEKYESAKEQKKCKSIK